VKENNNERQEEGIGRGRKGGRQEVREIFVGTINLRTLDT